MKDGWFKPQNTNKFHYFKNRVSLCGRWAMFVWGDDDIDEHDLIGHKYNCKACEKKRVKQLRKSVTPCQKDDIPPQPS